MVIWMTLAAGSVNLVNLLCRPGARDWREHPHPPVSSRPGWPCQLGRAGWARYMVLLGDGGPCHLFEGGGTAGGCPPPSLGCCSRTSSDRAGHLQILGFILWASRAETQRGGYSVDVGEASGGRSRSTQGGGDRSQCSRGGGAHSQSSWGGGLRSQFFRGGGVRSQSSWGGRARSAPWADRAHSRARSVPGAHAIRSRARSSGGQRRCSTHSCGRWSSSAPSGGRRGCGIPLSETEEEEEEGLFHPSRPGGRSRALCWPGGRPWAAQAPCPAGTAPAPRPAGATHVPRPAGAAQAPRPAGATQASCPAGPTLAACQAAGSPLASWRARAGVVCPSGPALAILQGSC